MGKRKDRSAASGSAVATDDQSHAQRAGWASAPHDVLVQIYRFLSTADRLSAQLVCKCWASPARAEDAWPDARFSVSLSAAEKPAAAAVPNRIRMRTRSSKADADAEADEAGPDRSVEGVIALLRQPRFTRLQRIELAMTVGGAGSTKASLHECRAAYRILASLAPESRSCLREVVLDRSGLPAAPGRDGASVMGVFVVRAASLCSSLERVGFETNGEPDGVCCRHFAAGVEAALRDPGADAEPSVKLEGPYGHEGYEGAGVPPSEPLEPRGVPGVAALQGIRSLGVQLLNTGQATAALAELFPGLEEVAELYIEGRNELLWVALAFGGARRLRAGRLALADISFASPTLTLDGAVSEEDPDAGAGPGEPWWLPEGEARARASRWRGLLRRLAAGAHSVALVSCGALHLAGSALQGVRQLEIRAPGGGSLAEEGWWPAPAQDDALEGLGDAKTLARRFFEWLRAGAHAPSVRVLKLLDIDDLLLQAVGPGDVPEEEYPAERKRGAAAASLLRWVLGAMPLEALLVDSLSPHHGPEFERGFAPLWRTLARHLPTLQHAALAAGHSSSMGGSGLEQLYAQEEARRRRAPWLALLAALRLRRRAFRAA
eukprot:tig00020960_g16581.t1